MNQMPKKAVALISGGLDSMIAARLMLEQNIHVEGLNFYTGFCHSGHTSAVRRSTKPKRNDALWAAEQLGIKLHIMDRVEAYQDVLTKPKYGYGKYLNPCLDCKVFMVREAKQWMEQHQFDFIVTGEVLGQRPKSQLKTKMLTVMSQSGAEDRLLRPLSAQLMPPTLPEREGWVDRERLLAIHGRGRSQQIALAKQWNWHDYAQPSGGCCVLTDANYANRLNDMWQGRGRKDYSLDDIILLKIGRHLRPNKQFKLIIGREEGENNFLSGYRNQFIHIETVSHPGPFILIDGCPTQEDIQLAARIGARFSSGRDAQQVTVKVVDRQGCEQMCTVTPLPAEAILKQWYV